jgi:hypothetical protein
MMSLILCRMEFDVVLNVEEEKTMGEIGELAKRFGEEEAGNAKMTTATLVSSPGCLPREWLDSIPYSEDAKSQDDRTCRQILKQVKP